MSLDIKKTKLLQSINYLKRIFGGYARQKILFHTGADISNIDVILNDEEILCELISYYNQHVNPFAEGTQNFREYNNSHEGQYARR